MKVKKYFAASAFVCAAVFAANAGMPSTSYAAEATAAAPAAAPAAADSDATHVKSTEYRYTSEQYGYSITCPKKPVGVIPASALYEGQKGEVLIFDNDGYNIKRAWMVLADSYSDKDIPDLTKLTEDQQKELIKKFTDHGNYEFVRIAEMNGTKGLYTVTAKEIEVDSNGDGKPDTTAKADSQMVETFFQGAYGGRFAVALLDNPELTREGVADYRAGLLTFQQWPTNASSSKDAKANHKK